MLPTPNPDDFQPSGHHNPDENLLVRFFHKQVQNKLESQAQGRPVFREKEYIEIRVPGQRDVQACRPATYQDKQRFPRHYEAFQKRVEPPSEGMPLTEWPKITRTLAEELSFLNVKTVEQLASMKDANLSRIMGGFGLREQAQKWLEANGKSLEEEERARLNATIARLESQVAQLLDAQNSKPLAAEKKPEAQVEMTFEGSDSDVDAGEDAGEDEVKPATTRATRRKRA